MVEAAAGPPPTRTSDRAPTVVDGPPIAAPRPADPARIGRFTVLHRLGAGGMGVVYAAYDPKLDRKIAVKLVRGDAGVGSDGSPRLLREAQALARVSHPNVVAVHDVGVHEGGEIYIAMEFVTGVDLRLWLEEGRRPWREVLGVYLQAGEGLAAVHQAGLIHRDFKPDNVLVGDDGRVRVVDLGLVGMSHETASWRGPAARPGPAAADPRLTVPGAFMGTPAYMSPEQHRGEGVGPASDLFNFCVALHEGLHGLRPFDGGDTGELLAAVVAHDIRVAPEGSDVPAWLDRVVRRGLAPAPADRWPSMRALLDALRDDPEARRRQRVRAAALATIAVLGALTIAALISATLDGWRRGEAERAAAAAWSRAEERMVALRGEGHATAADELFAAFVDADEHRGTRARAAAWRWRAARAREDRDALGARIALARAYGDAQDRAGEAAALHDLSALLLETWSFELFSEVARRARGLASGGARPDPAAAALALRASIADRDLAGVPAAIDELGADAGPLAPWRRVLANLAGATATGQHAGRVVPLPGGGVLLADASAVTLADASPALPTRRRIDLGDRFSAPPWWVGGGLEGPLLLVGAWDLGAARTEVELVQVDADGPRTLRRWQESVPLAAVAGDLGDGAPRIFVGIGPYGRQILELRRADGAWETLDPHPRTTATRSDVTALRFADLDGIGGDELIAALGPWGAYDLRVFRGGDPGLDLRARHKLGHVAALADVRDPRGGRLLVALKTDAYANPSVFPADQPTGAPPGIHAFRLDDDALVPAGFIPAPRPLGAAGPLAQTDLLAGDLDGDGVDEIVSAARSESGEALLLLHNLSQETDPPIVLRGLAPRAVAELDGDPAAELVVADAHDGALWVLGAGVDRLPPVTGAAASAPARAAATAASPIERRADDLAAMGLGDEAAGVLVSAAELAADPADRAALLARAAELQEAAGDLDAAIDTYGRLALAPEGVIGGLRGAARCQRAAGRLADALTTLDALLARSDLPAALAREAAADQAELARLVRPSRHARIDFGAPLDRAWSIADPIGARRDPIAGRLRVDAFANGDPIAALPLVGVDGALSLRVELALERLEWGGGVLVGVRPIGDPLAPPSLAVGLEGAGGREALEHFVHCVTAPRRRYRDFVTIPVVDAAAPLRGALEIAVQGDVAVCTWTADGEPPRRGVFKLPAPLGDDPLELVIAPVQHGSNAPAWSAVRVAAIELGGAEIAAPAATSPLAAARRWQADGELEAAVSAYRGAAHLDGVDRVALGLALADLGRLHGAEEALAAALAAADAAALAALGRALRSRPRQLAPLLHDAGDEALARLILEVWQTSAMMNPDDAMVDALTAILDGDPAWQRSGPLARLVRFWLLTCRGRAWRLRRADERARRDLRLALELLGEDPSIPPAIDPDRLIASGTTKLHTDLSILAARSGSIDEAIEHALATLAASSAPETQADALWVQPDLVPLQAAPRWRAALGR